MGVSTKLAISYLKSNKKKTLITAICILISTVLITTIFLLIDSYKEYMINSERNKANWEVVYSGITYEEACTIEKHSNVKEISVMKEMGEARKKDEKDIVIPEKIIGYDEIAIKNLLKNNLQAGRLPENSNEVIRTDGSYKIGDKLVQTLDGGETKEYTVVGIVNDYSNLISSFELITLLDRKDLKKEDKVNITIISNDIKRVYDNYYDIYYQLGSYRNAQGSSLESMTKYNETLLEYAGVLDYVSEFQKNIYTLEGIFIGIIVVSSMAFIYSVINISIVERKHYFGILKSIGTTVKQMKRSIRVELTIILLITIPLGVFIGIGLDLLLIKAINNIFPEIATSYHVLSSMLEANEGMRVAIPLSTIGLSIITIVLSVYLASIIPIRKVSRIQAINMIKQDNVKARKENKNKEVKHIERKLAYKNIERYKSRYIAIIMSLTISISLIIVSNYYIVNIASKMYESDYNYWIDLKYDSKEYGNLREKVINDIQEANIASKIFSEHMYGYTILINEKNISSEEKELGMKLYNKEHMYPHFDLNYASKEYKMEDILDVYNLPISILIMDEDNYNTYLKEIGVDRLEENECILVDYINEKTKYYDGLRITNYQEGDNLTLTNGSMRPGEDVEEFIRENAVYLKIKKITDKIPKNLFTNEKGSVVIANEETINNLAKQRAKLDGCEYVEDTKKWESIYLKVTDIDKANNFVKEIKEKYNLNYYDEADWYNQGNDKSIQVGENNTQEEVKKAYFLRDVFIYSFIGIISIVGVLNMYNAINTSLETRKREIVRLITIGMEEKQINKMLFAENGICGMLALILGIAIGIIASYIVYLVSIDYLWYSFEIPWTPILISILAILLVTIISTIYLKKKIFVDDLMDILKREEF